MLNQVKEFLAKVTERIPNRLPAHHALVLMEDGHVELTLFFHEKWVLPVIFDEGDLTKPIEELVEDVVRLHADFMRD